MNVQPFLVGDGWIEVRDGDSSCLDIFLRHYSCSPARRKDAKLFMGPGSKLALLSADGKALCGWRKSVYRADGQTGVECVVFRREGGDVASAMLRSARIIAQGRWPGERFFTFVDPLRVAPTPRAGRPTWGHCFYQDGWSFAGITKKRLHVLQRFPDSHERIARRRIAEDAPLLAGAAE